MLVPLCVCAITAVCYPAPPPLAGQTSTRTAAHQGFWGGFGLTSGRLHLACAGCGSLPQDIIGVYLRMGGTLNSQLLLAGELGLWIDDYARMRLDDPEKGRISGRSLLVLVQYYPSRSTGFFGTAGVGYVETVARPLTSVTIQPPGDRDSHGVALLIGGGYDIRIRRRLTITPRLAYQYVVAEEVEVNGGRIDTRMNAHIYGFTLGITWH